MKKYNEIVPNANGRYEKSGSNKLNILISEIIKNIGCVNTKIVVNNANFL